MPLEWTIGRVGAFREVAMLRVQGPAKNGLTRRDLLRVGSLSLFGGMTLPSLLRARGAKVHGPARSVRLNSRLRDADTEASNARITSNWGPKRPPRPGAGRSTPVPWRPTTRTWRCTSGSRATQTTCMASWAIQRACYPQPPSSQRRNIFYGGTKLAGNAPGCVSAAHG